MKKLYIIANWKSNKTTKDAKQWLEEISFTNTQDKEVILCPSFTLLFFLKDEIVRKNLPIKLGAQNISSFGEGAFTGEVNEKQLKELCEYVIIGHSERRTNQKEINEELKGKVEKANEVGLKVIFCVQSENNFVPKGVEIVAYEPINAIGTGNPDTPENAEKVAKTYKNNFQNIIYGGSVNKDNVNSFTQLPDINGVLVGGASLDAKTFGQIIQNA